MAKGNYTNSYATTQSSGFNPTNWLHKEQDRQTAMDELSRKRAEEDRKRKQENEKAFTDATRYTVKIDPSTIPNVNALKSAIWDAGKERVFELSETMDKYKNDPYSQEYKNAEREIMYINDTLANQANLITKAWEDDMLKAASGKYLLNPNQLKSIDSYSKTPMEIALGSGGRVIIKRDTDGDGTLDFITKDEFINGNLLGQLVPNVDEVDFVKKLNIGNIKVDDVQGLRTITEKNPWELNVFGDENNPKSLKNVVTDTIKSQILDSNGQLNDIGKSFAYKRGMYDLDNLSPDEVDMIVEDLSEMKRADMGFEKSIAVRNPARSSSGSSSKQSSSNNSEDVYGTLAKNRVRPTKSVWGDKFDKISPENRFSVPVSKSVKIGSREELQSPKQNTIKDLDSGKSYTNSTIESYTYDDKGNLYAKISYIDDKGGVMSAAAKDYKIKELINKGVSQEKAIEQVNNLSNNNPETKKTAIIRADSDTKRDIANFLGISMDDLWNLGVDNDSPKNVQETETKKTIEGF